MKMVIRICLIVLSCFSLQALSAPKVAQENINCPAESITESCDLELTAASIVGQASKALGGTLRLQRAVSQRVLAKVTRYDAGQNLEISDEPVVIGDILMTTTKMLGDNRSNTHRTTQTKIASLLEFDYTEIINGQNGAILGFEGFSGLFERAMPASRLSARSKQQLLLSPISLLKRAQLHADYIELVSNGSASKKKYYIVSIPGFPERINLYINKSTFVLEQAETIERDPVQGDGRFVAYYTDWESYGEFRAPSNVEFRINDVIIRNEKREFVEFNPSLSENEFTVSNALQERLDREDFDWGYKHAQWVLSFITLGPAMDTNPNQPEDITYHDLGNGLTHVRGQIHHTLVVEMSDYLVVLEPGVFSERSENIISDLKERWPAKPIRYIFSSHFHRDHSGGIRPYMAEGAKVIAGADTTAFYQYLANASYVLFPDSLSTAAIEPEVIEISDINSFILQDGDRVLRFFPVENTHSKDMIVAYIEDAKTVFVSDLYNPNEFPLPFDGDFTPWAKQLQAGLETTELDIQTLVGAHGTVAPWSQFVAEANF